MIINYWFYVASIVLMAAIAIVAIACLLLKIICNVTTARENKRALADLRTKLKVGDRTRFLGSEIQIIRIDIEQASRYPSVYIIGAYKDHSGAICEKIFYPNYFYQLCKNKLTRDDKS